MKEMVSIKEKEELKKVEDTILEIIRKEEERIR